MFDIDDAQNRGASKALKGKQVFRYPPSPRCLACEIQVYEEGRGEGKGRGNGRAREGGKRSEDVLYVAGCWERHARRDRRKWLQSGERNGKRSSLGNLFWSSQSTDTQGAGKPITV